MTNEMAAYLSNAGLTVEPDDLPDYYDAINKAMQSNCDCQKCKGLQYCKSDAQGLKYVLEKSPTGKISPSYRRCKFQIQHIRAMRIAKLLSSSRMPDLFKDKSFDNYRQDDNMDAYMAAQRVVGDIGGKGLMLYGGPGTGKTHLAAAIVNTRLASGHEAVFVTVPELLSDIRETYNRNGETSELLEIVKDVDLLVLDDMGTERLTSWVCEQLFSVINARLMRKKQTVVTTNYTPSELIYKMAVKDRSGNIEDDLPGKRIVSRLTEMCQKVEMKGEDKRLGGVI